MLTSDVFSLGGSHTYSLWVGLSGGPCCNTPRETHPERIRVFVSVTLLSQMCLYGTGWRRCIGCLKTDKSQVYFRKRATNSRVLLRKMICKDGASYDYAPPCTRGSTYKCFCSALLQTALYCNTLHCIASHCDTLHHTATLCITLQHSGAHCIILKHKASHCITLHHAASHCNTLHHTASHCYTLQHSATHCNTPFPMMDPTHSSGTSMCCFTVPSCLCVCCSLLQCVAVCCSMLY